MKRNSGIGWVVSLGIMGLMGLAAAFAGIQEIIFPETAALLTGCFLVPRRPWNVPHGVLTLEMSLCALAGILISRYMMIPLYFKVLTATALVFALLVTTGTAMLPAISAFALPVLIGTTEWIYVIAVVVIAALCDLGNLFFEKNGIMERRTYDREERNPGHWTRMLLVFAVVLLFPMLTGLKFMVAPPLIVAFPALSGTDALAANRLLPTVGLFAGTAWIGFFCRILSDGTVVPETLWMMAAAAGAWLLFTLMKRFFPPAAAIAVLPFLLPADGLWKYPLEIMAGILFLYFAAWVVSIWEVKTNY